MKALKIVGYVLLGLVGLVVVTGLIVPAELHVESTRVVHAPKEIVAEYVTNLKKMQEWSVWAAMDPALENEYEGEDGKPGSILRWKGPEMGVGMQELLVVNDSMMVSRLSFLEPWETVNEAKIQFKAVDSAKTSVTWTLTGPAPFPINAMLFLTGMAGQMGNDFDRGLMMLDTVVAAETARSYFRGHRISETQLEEATYLVRKASIAIPELGAVMPKAYEDVATALQKQQLAPVSSPTAFYFKWDETQGTVEFAAGFAFSGEIKPVKGLETLTAGGRSLLISYYGDPAESANAHYAMDDYMKKNSLVSRFVLERYVTDTAAEPDTSKWLTQIYYVLEK